jgi:hypothetical protein
MLLFQKRSRGRSPLRGHVAALVRKACELFNSIAEEKNEPELRSGESHRYGDA